jgi:ABC-2 type transport system permease protein
MRGALPVAGRVLLGVAGDRPTLALVAGAPFLLFLLFGQVLDAVPAGGINAAFMRPLLLSLFLFILTYLLTGIGFLRERQQGTLERILTTRATRSGLVAGYFLGFGALALVQSSALAAAGVLFLKVEFPHGFLPFYALELLGALAALGLGIAASILARTELQVIQFVPVALAPQLILGGVFVPVDALPAWLQPVSRALPLTYLVDGMKHLTLAGAGGDLGLDAAVLGGFVALSAVAAVTALRVRS